MVINIIKKIFFQIIVAFFMIVSVVVVWSDCVSAAGIAINGELADKYIKLEATGNGTWTASSTEIEGSVTGEAGGGCGNDSPKESTLSICNNSSVRKTLSFECIPTQNGGTIVVDRQQFNGSQEYSKELNPGEKIEIVIKSKAGKYTTSVVIKNISLISNNKANITFKTSEGGSYTVDNEVISEDRTFNRKPASEGYYLSAKPDSGYEFWGWYRGDILISKSSDYVLKADEDSIITAKFIVHGTPILGVGRDVYFDMKEAIKAAQLSNTEKTIVVLKDCILNGDYVIPGGVTLLIPFNNENTCYTEVPEADTADLKKEEYRRLTINGTLTVCEGGAVSVSAKHHAGQGSPAGVVTGKYGHIVLNKNSKIVLDKGASLYAYGYISGEGIVDAKNGSEVREYFQIVDYRGGNATNSLLNNKQKVFPFNQYYIQNIESKLRVHYGAKEKLYTSINATLIGQKHAEVPFIGANSLFEILSDDGYVEKEYNCKTDKLEVNFYGTGKINPIKLSIGLDVDSSKYVLPITNSLQISIKRGEFNVTQDISLLPGAELTVDKSAKLNIPAEINMFVYSANEWRGKKFAYRGDIRICPYAVSRVNPTESPRTPDNLEDAKLDVNGVLHAEGYIYTTNSGANITSSQRTGLIHFGSEYPTTDKRAKLYEYQQESSSYAEVETTCMKLKNGPTNFTLTDEAKADWKYTMNSGIWEATRACEPVFSLEEGVYNQEQTIELKTDTEGAKIYYTLGGEDPTENSTLYDGNDIKLKCSSCKDSSITIKAIAVKDGYKNSRIAKRTYIFEVGHPVNNLELVKGKAASCTEAGWKDYYKCSKCNTLLTAKTDGTTISDLETWKTGEGKLDAKGHTEVKDAGKAPTCTEPGLSEGKHCSVCHKVLEEQKVVPATGEHIYVDGKCSVCGKASPVIPPSGGSIGGNDSSTGGNTHIYNIINQNIANIRTTIAKADSKLETSENGKTTIITEICKAFYDQIINKASDNKSTVVVIRTNNNDVLFEDSEESFIIAKEFIEELSKANLSSFKLRFYSAEICFDNITLDAVRKQLIEDNLSVHVKSIPKNKRTYAQDKICGDNGIAIGLDLNNNGNHISNMCSGSVSITVPIPKNLSGKDIKALVVTENGRYISIKGKKFIRNNKEYCTITTNKFSTFVITESKLAEERLRAQYKSDGVKNTAIKLSAYVNKKGPLTIRWTKSTGYKIDYYQIYRTTKKGKFGKTPFKTVHNGNKKCYVNIKTMKGGKTYYYKVRGVRITDDGKVYTRWSNVIRKTTRR